MSKLELVVSIVINYCKVLVELILFDYSHVFDCALLAEYQILVRFQFKIDLQRSNLNWIMHQTWVESAE